MMQQNGQVLIILVLITLVALTIGLSVTERSVSDIAISTKTEQSSRAFSAAEAGIEKAIQQDISGAPVSQTGSFGNDANFTLTPTTSLPRPGQVLEYPKIGKAEFAHFWLADPNQTPPTQVFGHSKLALYFGVPSNDPSFSSTDLPAVEINTVTRSGAGNYVSNRKFYDSNAGRASTNGFTRVDANCTNPAVYTSFSKSSAVADKRSFYCQVDVDVPVGVTPILARVRVLYSDNSQFVALGVGAGCSDPDSNPDTYGICDLPPQANVYTSEGFSGATKRKLQLFRSAKVVPFYFDYAIFSMGDITKN